MLSLPVLGTLFTKVAISRFTSTFAVLLRSGVDILKSLQIVKDVAGNVILAQALERASQNVGEGDSLAGPLSESGVFPPIVIKMIESGQRSSNLELMLETVAEDYENEVENTILGLTAILEPLIILVMGGFVCFIVVAILVPLQDMANI
jgi:general secretion pathway protein F